MTINGKVIINHPVVPASSPKHNSIHKLTNIIKTLNLFSTQI